MSYNIIVLKGFESLGTTMLNTVVTFWFVYVSSRTIDGATNTILLYVFK